MRLWLVCLAVCVSMPACVKRAPSRHELARRSGEVVPPVEPRWTETRGGLELHARAAAVDAQTGAEVFGQGEGVKVWVPGLRLGDGRVLWGWVWVPVTRPDPPTLPPEGSAPVATPMPRRPR